MRLVDESPQPVLNSVPKIFAVEPALQRHGTHLLQLYPAYTDKEI